MTKPKTCPCHEIVRTANEFFPESNHTPHKHDAWCLYVTGEFKLLDKTFKRPTIKDRCNCSCPLCGDTFCDECVMALPVNQD